MNTAAWLHCHRRLATLCKCADQCIYKLNPNNKDEPILFVESSLRFAEISMKAEAALIAVCEGHPQTGQKNSEAENY